jgi:hypothetical protein
MVLIQEINPWQDKTINEQFDQVCEAKYQAAVASVARGEWRDSSLQLAKIVMRCGKTMEDFEKDVAAVRAGRQPTSRSNRVPPRGLGKHRTEQSPPAKLESNWHKPQQIRSWGSTLITEQARKVSGFRGASGLGGGSGFRRRADW